MTGEALRHSLHEAMSHAGARAVGEHVAGARIGRRLQQSGDGRRAIDGDGHRFRGVRMSHGPAPLWTVSGACPCLSPD